jgi:drug/metabolite transporter (DMT)-like permease
MIKVHCTSRLCKLIPATDIYQAFTPVAVLVVGWILQVEKVDLRKLGNVALIVIGVAIASFGEIDFVLIGFLYQLGGIVFEATRLCLVQKLLNGEEFKMNPLVSLYYFAPVCAAMNVLIALVWEVPKCTMAEVYQVGLWVFLANAFVAFALNVSVVFLVRNTHSLSLSAILTSNPDRQNIWPRPYPLRCP